VWSKICRLVLGISTNILLKSAYIENKFLHSQGCDTWYSGLQRLFKIFDNNTGIHNMLKQKKSNSDKIWTIWKKGKLNSEMIWKIFVYFAKYIYALS
jgi:hypothetical protein